MARRSKPTDGMGFSPNPPSASDAFPVKDAGERSTRRRTRGGNAAERQNYGPVSDPASDNTDQQDAPYARPAKGTQRPELDPIDYDEVQQALDDSKTEGVSTEAFDIDFTGNPAIDLGWLAQQDNLARFMLDDARRRFGEDLLRLHEANLASIDEWRAGAEEGIEAADMRRPANAETGDENDGTEEAPPPRYPLITHAGVEFSAKAFEALFSDPLIVKVEDPTPAGEVNNPDRVKASDDLAYFLSYQTQVLDEGWVDGTDELLHHLALTGMAWRKRWYDPREKRFCSAWYKGWEVVVNNSCTKIDREPLISHPFQKYPHEVRQHVASGYYFDVDMTNNTASGDWFKPIDFVECHAWLDWDDDGIDEPWIITIQVETKQIVRVVTAWQPHGVLVDDHGITFERECDFTPYRLVPAADGTFYAKGFGHLLGSIGTTVDELLSEIVKTAKLNNSNGGVVGRVGGGMPETITLRPNELQVIPVDGQELSKSIVWFPTKEVPQTLFSVLGLLTDAGKQLASSVDLMPDGTPANMPATTAMAIVQQGSRIYSAILRRIWRAMTREFQQLYDLNKRYSQDELPFDFLGRKGVIAAEMFDRTRNVQVAADPQMSSDMLRAMAMELYSKFLNDPMTDQMELRKRIWKLARVPAPEALVQKPPEGPSPELQIKMMEAQAKLLEAQSKVAERDDIAKHQATVSMKDMIEAMAALHTLVAGTPEQPAGPEGEPGAPAQPGGDIALLAAMTLQLYQQLSDAINRDNPNPNPDDPNGNLGPSIAPPPVGGKLPATSGKPPVGGKLPATGGVPVPGQQPGPVSTGATGGNGVPGLGGGPSDIGVPSNPQGTA